MLLCEREKIFNSYLTISVLEIAVLYQHTLFFTIHFFVSVIGSPLLYQKVLLSTKKSCSVKKVPKYPEKFRLLLKSPDLKYNSPINSWCVVGAGSVRNLVFTKNS